jgi:hypothetical protein
MPSFLIILLFKFTEADGHVQGRHGDTPIQAWVLIPPEDRLRRFFNTVNPHSIIPSSIESTGPQYSVTWC